MSRLWWWISFSGVLHLLMIMTLFFVPTSTARRSLPAPVYTVELLEGELGKVGPGLGELPASRKKAAPPEPEKTESIEEPVLQREDDGTPFDLDDGAIAEAPAPEPEVKKPVTRVEPVPREVPKKPEAALVEPQPKPTERQTQRKLASAEQEKKVRASKKNSAEVKKKTSRKKTKKAESTPVKLAKKTSRVKKKSTRVSKAKRDPAAAERVRERLIRAAVERAKERARKKQLAEREANAAGAVRGTGRGGVADRGQGSGGDGVVKGLEFVIYRNRMLQEIKERWTWLGKRDDLEVTVRFGIGNDGEIIGLNIVNASGDASYDASVLRAVRRASPLPRPPVSYLSEFSDVELTFRPKDLSG